MILLLLLAQVQAPAIVVQGERLSQALRQCEAGQCTVRRDAQVSIASAETLFRDGEYLKAKLLLTRAIDRNRRHEATSPKLVSSLYEAYATVSLHEGDESGFRRGTRQQVRILRDHLPADDPAVIAKIMALSDMWFKLRDYRQAKLSYQAAEQQAERAGQAEMAAVAAIRVAWLTATMGHRTAARAMLDEIAARPAARTGDLPDVIQIMRFRLDASSLSDEEMLRRSKSIGAGYRKTPLLVVNPAYDFTDLATVNNAASRFQLVTPIPVLSSDVSSVQWVDVGFWIRPDGRTDEVEILRGMRAESWARSIVRQVEGRVYSSFASAPGEKGASGMYRVERVTLRQRYQVPVGSLIERRVPVGGVETLDLTAA